MFQAEARAVVRSDGSGVMETGAHDMGQGAWTALAQIAADGLGLELEQMEFRAGTSDLPDAGIAGGSAHTATAGMAIHNAGAAVIGKLADLATGDERSPLFGAGNAGVIARDGRLFRRDDETRSESYADILGRAGLREIEARGKGAADPAAQSTYAMHAHGAVFAEVKVDPDLGQIRVTRLVGAFAAGRVINPRLVQSQNLWRHDLGRIICTARAGGDGSPLRPDHERQPCRVPRPGERRRAVSRGADG
jgi:xanthine dehydrogenase YagR molybdenum-binding subunit